MSLQLLVCHHPDLSCLMIALDFFEEINDTFGHNFGDPVRREFCALGVSAVNTRAHIMTVQSIEVAHASLYAANPQLNWVLDPPQSFSERLWN